jgi:hypothetical protein
MVSVSAAPNTTWIDLISRPFRSGQAGTPPFCMTMTLGKKHVTGTTKVERSDDIFAPAIVIEGKFSVRSLPGFGRRLVLLRR